MNVTKKKEKQFLEYIRDEIWKTLINLIHNKRKEAYHEHETPYRKQ